jgi:hypothetical protein
MALLSRTSARRQDDTCRIRWAAARCNRWWRWGPQRCRSRVAETGNGILSALFDIVISTGPEDFGLINNSPGVAPGLGIDQLNLVIYGLLIIGFLIFEPLGLYGIWLKVRNYWKGWPFTY